MEITKTVLHVGCGRNARRNLHWSFKGWKQITVDVDARCEPDVVASIVAMPSVPGDSVNAVQCSHCLEHLRAHEVPLALAEFLRVLKPDGDLLIQVPDLRQACKAVAEGREELYLYQSPGGAVAPLDMIYGHRLHVRHVGDSMLHKTGFTDLTLWRTLEAAGFVQSKAWVDGFDLWATAQKQKTMT